MSILWDIRWKQILSLGAIQIVPASLALVNLYPQWVELLIGGVFIIVWVAALRILDVDRPFLSGLCVGLSAGLVTAVIQASFVRVYLQNHPDLLQSNPDASILAWAASIAGVSLLGGVVVGLITGGLTWLVLRIGPPREPELPA